MRVGLDLRGADDKQQLINYINSNDESITFVVYGLQEDLDLLTKNNVEKILCTEEVLIEDDSARVHRRKKDSTMIKMLQDQKDGVIDVSISAGSTGAFMASSLFILGRIEGVAKPALATMLPTVTDHKFLLTDLGANVEAKSNDLLNYAKLGNLYIKYMYNKENPSVALLNIGEEPTKGNKLYKETHILLKENVSNFKGNIEARNILDHKYDVIIADGFAGNVILKTIEGVAISFSGLLKGIFLKNIKTKISALLVKSGLKSFRKKFDYSEYGGAVLLGLQKPAIKIHGSADEKAVHFAVQQAKKMHKTKLYSKMTEIIKGE
ncbi:phosphate acyltransferase PlsX [Gemella sp. GH3]|uniref:phosphate acyltransferase PlsX n=1 Tax=unclassified Gemella TaxID=2624949 RepID=UPI0015D0C9A6|nr:MULTISPECIES: phosphate acyltransferase PlsX [unclassified Gemella]MBF0714298.1 phosphate acyltransferase PlsX [Gemella sp. GH3.1]NYS51250.1 phosphate acyltransferase PlsX [Gemella sp. GH3]